MEKRTVPPPPPSPGSNMIKEQKFMYVDNFTSVCTLNDYLTDGWKFVTMAGANPFALVLIERTVRKEDAEEDE